MKVIRIFAWLYIFIVPIVFGVMDKPAVMTASILTGCLILAFAYLDKIESFKGAGFEAKLRDAVNEAYATIEKLRDIAVKLSEPIVFEITMHQRMLQYVKLKYRYEQLKGIEASLQDLGVSKEEIEKTTEFFYETFREDHVKKVVYAVLADDKAPEELKKELEKYKEEDVPEEFKIADAVASYKYTPSSKVIELIKDSEHFDKEKTFRRIDTWQ